jgi:hypothetical protein
VFVAAAQVRAVTVPGTVRVSVQVLPPMFNAKLAVPPAAGVPVMV